MAISTVIYKGQLRTEAMHLPSENMIITDAPKDNHGKGEAFSPTDLVATALASCLLTIMGIVAQRHDWNIENTKAEVSKIMGENPRRIARIEVKITMPEQSKDFDAKTRQMLENAAKTCPVAQSLHEDLQQQIEFIYPS